MNAGRRGAVRPPAVAGTFYPASADRLDLEIRAAFAASAPSPEGAAIPKAIVVPHAGYIYSGPIAASAYARLAPARSRITRVVLLGPSHRSYVRGLAVSGADAFETPLGRVPVDSAGRATALAIAGVVLDERAHVTEHSLEVQLPFLQTVLDAFEVLPLSVGDATTVEVAEVLEGCWGGSETVIVISTDLSHYHRYDDAVALDSRTAAAIVSRRGDAISDDDACGSRPLRGLLRLAAERDMTVEQLDLRNSGDTAGDHGRVVGYGAFAVG